MEKKLEIAHCDEVDKVPFATHYLEGYAAIWWDNTKEVWPAREDINWDKFKEKFCTYHIPTGVLKTMQREFLALVQGSMTMTEYLNKFNHLARYSVHDVATEERKVDRFLGGLSPTLRCQLSMLDFPDFQILVNKALIAEREYKSVIELKAAYDDRKRKYEARKAPYEPSAQKPRMVQAAPQPAPTNFKPSWNNGNAATNKPAVQGKPFVSNQVREDCMRNGTCLNCGKPGHYAKQCTNKTGKPAPQVNNMGGQHNYRQARVNHTSAEEAREFPDVFVGMFPINNIPAAILFDSGATDSFLSWGFATQNNFSVSFLDEPVVVKTPRGILRASAVCKDLVIEIYGVKFPASLMLLESKGLDAILGVD